MLLREVRTAHELIRYLMLRGDNFEEKCLSLTEPLMKSWHRLKSPTTIILSMDYVGALVAHIGGLPLSTERALEVEMRRPKTYIFASYCHKYKLGDFNTWNTWTPLCSCPRSCAIAKVLEIWNRRCSHQNKYTRRGTWVVKIVKEGNLSYCMHTPPFCVSRDWPLWPCSLCLACLPSQWLWPSSSSLPSLLFVIAGSWKRSWSKSLKTWWVT